MQVSQADIPVPKELTVASGHGSKKTISAKIARACVNCQSPGVFQQLRDTLDDLSPEDQRVYNWRINNWPAVFVADARVGQIIEDICPCCGSARPPMEDRGVIGVVEV